MSGRIWEYLIVTVDELPELVGQDASAVVERELAAGQDHLQLLLEVAGCSPQEANHQVLRRQTGVADSPRPPLEGLDAI